MIIVNLPSGVIIPSITEFLRSGLRASFRFACRDRILFLYLTSVRRLWSLKIASSTRPAIRATKFSEYLSLSFSGLFTQANRSYDSYGLSRAACIWLKKFNETFWQKTSIYEPVPIPSDCRRSFLQLSLTGSFVGWIDIPPRLTVFCFGGGVFSFGGGASFFFSSFFSGISIYKSKIKWIQYQILSHWKPTVALPVSTQSFHRLIKPIILVSWISVWL